MEFLTDLYPQKAQYAPGEEVCLELCCQNPTPGPLELAVSLAVTRRAETMETAARRVTLRPGESRTELLVLSPRGGGWEGYGVDVSAAAPGHLPCRISTAFDVAEDFRVAPRYGFLSHFGPEEQGNDADLGWMRKLHINLVQFYDWMYRHHRLIPPQEEFADLMGKRNSMKTVREKIGLCHRLGMKAMAYGAVYAAGEDFFRRHPDWALYDGNGDACCFIGTFYIMNPQAGCPWREYIIGEYGRALEASFDGIHMDTYGEPKSALSRLSGGKEQPVRLDEMFPGLIDDARRALAPKKEGLCLIFNNVGNWPMEETAAARQDAVYIEVWNPFERYFHLVQLIETAGRAGGGKPVILAAYLAPFRECPDAGRAEAAALLLMAAVTAHGAYPLLWGEEYGVLTQGYYVDHSTLRESFLPKVRAYCDFAVRYCSLFYDKSLRNVSMTHLGGDNTEYAVGNAAVSGCGEPGRVWAVLRESPRRKFVQLIDLRGNDDRWNSPKDHPQPAEGLTVRVQILTEPKSVFFASPGLDGGRPITPRFQILHEKAGKFIEIEVPSFSVWALMDLEW